MKRLLCILMLFLCVFVAAAAETAPEELTFPMHGQTNEKAVNVRRSAYSKGEKVEQLKKGSLLEVTGFVYDKEGTLWYSVRTEKGKEGFIANKYLDLLTEEEYAAAAAATAAPAVSGAATKGKSTTSSSSGGYSGKCIGNKSSKVFHRTSCGSLPASKNRVTFSNRSAAISAGYKPCKHCKP